MFTRRRMCVYLVLVICKVPHALLLPLRSYVSRGGLPFHLFLWVASWTGAWRCSGSTNSELIKNLVGEIFLKRCKMVKDSNV